jgi:hypothetical protein
MPASTDLDTNVRHRHPSSFGPTLLRGSLEDVRALQVRWRSEHVIIEYANAGQPLASELRRENAQWSSRLIPYRPRVEKAVRFAAQTAKIEEGKILRPAEAPWLAASSGASGVPSRSARRPGGRARSVPGLVGMATGAVGDLDGAKRRPDNAARHSPALMSSASSCSASGSPTTSARSASSQTGSASRTQRPPASPGAGRRHDRGV